MSFTVLQDDQIASSFGLNETLSDLPPKKNRKIVSESFYLILLTKTKTNTKITVKMWKIVFYADQFSVSNGKRLYLIDK